MESWREGEREGVTDWVMERKREGYRELERGRERGSYRLSDGEKERGRESEGESEGERERGRGGECCISTLNTTVVVMLRHLLLLLHRSPVVSSTLAMTTRPLSLGPFSRSIESQTRQTSLSWGELSTSFSWTSHGKLALWTFHEMLIRMTRQTHVRPIHDYVKYCLWQLIPNCPIFVVPSGVQLSQSVSWPRNAMQRCIP